MHQPLQLQITEPCHENWTQMTAQAQGRFCGSCQKTVIDFTNMSDSHLLEYFKNYSSNTCGRFENHQLDRVLTAPPPAKPSWYKWAFAMLFSGFLFSSKAKAQGFVGVFGKEIKQNHVAQKKGKVAIATTQKTIELRGRIVGETGVGIPYASVQVVGGNWGVSTDSLGNFTLVLKDSKPEKLLRFSSVGFIEQTRMIQIEGSEVGGLNITLSTSTNTGLAEVVVLQTALQGGVGGIGVFSKVSKQTRLSKVIAGRHQIIKLFPNPAKAGSSVKIQFTKTGNYDLRLIDLSGRILMAQGNIQLQETFYILQIPAEAAAGEYFLQIVDSKGKQLAVEKLVIIH